MAVGSKTTQALNRDEVRHCGVWKVDGMSGSRIDDRVCCQWLAVSPLLVLFPTPFAIFLLIFVVAG